LVHGPDDNAGAVRGHARRPRHGGAPEAFYPTVSPWPPESGDTAGRGPSEGYACR
jgi:hypothetical protein